MHSAPQARSKSARATHRPLPSPRTGTPIDSKNASGSVIAIPLAAAEKSASETCEGSVNPRPCNSRKNSRPDPSPPAPAPPPQPESPAAKTPNITNIAIRSPICAIVYPK